MEALKIQLANLDTQTLSVWLQHFTEQVRARKGVVAAVVGFMMVHQLYSAIASVPLSLRHVKATNRVREYRYMIQGKSVDVRRRLLTVPLMKQTGVGVYLSGDRGAWTVMVAEPKAARTLLMKTSKGMWILQSSILIQNDSQAFFPKTALAKRPDGELFYKFAGRKNIVNSNGDEWKKHRKPANPAFHKSMPISLFERLTKVFFKHAALQNNHVNLNELMQRFTLDAIGNGAFDFDFQAMENPEGLELQAYNKVMHTIFSPINSIFPWLDTFLFKVSKGRREMHKQAALLNNLMQRMITKKKQTIQAAHIASVDDEEKDLLMMMLEANQEEVDPSKRLTDADLRNDLVVFFVAGHDTTSNALTYALYHLAVNPDVQQRAREECIRVLGDAPEDIVPDAEQIKHLTYISQIIQETLRTEPPASGASQHIDADDAELGGYFIPKGTMVGLDIWGLHHNPNVWDDPETWNPDRFAPGGEYDSKDSYSWLPFGHGQR
ncbi:hypothetical protein BZG36_02470 [Bifiguratus adelaidae]|uniref:Cytochrome P450 n=1 Tax=Bifiguratus adelaidae TaxID=1938954 RepID=A0A261Y0Z8_9FUNG|nr:hypothetical protein BZG36_02470 [Bifiguratus adelaidae]